MSICVQLYIFPHVFSFTISNTHQTCFTCAMSLGNWFCHVDRKDPTVSTMMSWQSASQCHISRILQKKFQFSNDLRTVNSGKWSCFYQFCWSSDWLYSSLLSKWTIVKMTNVGNHLRLFTYIFRSSVKDNDIVFQNSEGMVVNSRTAPMKHVVRETS